MKKKAIINFAKYPDEGKVKSRLAETTGNGFAAELYKITSKFIFTEAASLFDSQQDCFLFYSGDKKVNEFKSWVKFDFNFLLYYIVVIRKISIIIEYLIHYA